MSSLHPALRDRMKGEHEEMRHHGFYHDLSDWTCIIWTQDLSAYCPWHAHLCGPL